VNDVEVGIDFFDQRFERGQAMLADALSVERVVGFAYEVENQTDALRQVEVIVQRLPVTGPNLVDPVAEFEIVVCRRS